MRTRWAGRSGRVRAGVTMAALVAALMLASAPAASARSEPAPGDFFGLNVEQLFTGNFAGPERWPHYIGTFTRAGIRTGRLGIYWDRVEPDAPGNGGVHHYNWEAVDRAAEALSRHGAARMKLVITHTPRWASTAPPGDSDFMSYPPRSPAEFGEFTRQIALRYGPGGSFWRSRGDLPAVAPLTYEIWNEQNHAYYWRPAPDPAAYVRVYNAGRDGIHAADPSARVLVGGVVWNDDAHYIRGMYAAAGPGWQPDGIGLHPYANSLIGIVINLRRVYSALQAMGHRPPLYLSELGWVAVPPGQAANHWFEGPMTDATRAGMISFLGDAAARSDCNIKSFVVYDVVEAGLNLYDAAANPNLSGQALAAALARYPGAVDGSLGVCGAGSPIERQLKLELDPRPTQDGCFTPYVTYRGFPIEEARVFFNPEGGRVDVAHTNANGIASYCPRGADAAKRMWMWAELSWETVPPVASSDDFACNPCTRAPPGTRPAPKSASTPPAVSDVRIKTGRRTGGKAGRIGLAIRPLAVRVGKRARVVFTVVRRVGKRRRAVPGATVHFAGLRLRTNKRGRVAWFARYARPGRYRVVATNLGSHRAVGWLRAVR